MIKEHSLHLSGLIVVGFFSVIHAAEKSGHPLVAKSGNPVLLRTDQYADVAKGLNCTMTVVDWDGDGGRDILLIPNPNLLGRGIYLFKEDQSLTRKIPIYLPPVNLTHLKITGASPALTRSDNELDLLIYGYPTWRKEREKHRGELKLYRANLQNGKPVFNDEPEIIRCNGKSLKDICGGWLSLDLVKNPKTGLIDLIAYVMKGSAYRLNGRSPWDSNWPMAYNGPGLYPGDLGRGYDASGKWRGGNTDYSIFRLRNVGTPKKPAFSNLELLRKVSIFPRGGCATLMDMDRDGERDLLMFERIHHLVYVKGKGGSFTGEPVELDCSPLKGYLVKCMVPFDIDNDGEEELLLSGSAAVVWWIDYHDGKWHEMEPLRYHGGAWLCVETLAVPCFADMDSDGDLDIVAGDSAGFLWLFENASGKKHSYVYLSGKRLKAEGKTILHKGGATGSIQGPGEAGWGYLNPLTVDWDGDGDIDIITNDIKSDYLWYRNDGAKKNLKLAAPTPLMLDGKAFHGAWRSRPALWDADTLVVLNWQGLLQFFDRDEKNPAVLRSGDLLQYKNGDAIIGCGHNGLWGRNVFFAADWDGDGRQDLIGGIHHSQGPIIHPGLPRRATAFWFRNVGTSENPVFNRPELIRTQDGKYINLDVHKCAVWVEDFDGDKRPDLAAGAEDGRVYVWYRKDLK